MATEKRIPKKKEPFEVESDYGLRTRGTIDARRNGSEGIRTPTVWERFPANSGFKPLAFTEIKDDMKRINARDENHDGDTFSPDPAYEASGGDDAHDRSLRPGKRRRKSTLNKDLSRLDERSSNFFYAYKRTKNREESLDFAEFVSEQKYLSTRHAYLKKLEIAKNKSTEQKCVISRLKALLRQKVNGPDGVLELSKTSSLMQKALCMVKEHQERVYLLQEENAQLRKVIESSARGRHNSKKLLSSTMLELGSGVKLKAAKSTNPTVPDLFINTLYGAGWLEDIRSNGMLIVDFNWGGKGVISPQSLSSISINHLEKMFNNPKWKQKLDSIYDEQNKESNYRSEEKGSGLHFDSHWQNGPPRGVKLQLSPISTDLHFALHHAKPMDPYVLEKFYSASEISKYDLHADEILEIKEKENHGDWDCLTSKRINVLESTPFSWTEPNSSPWASNDLGLSRRELRFWEEERFELLQSKAIIRNLENELQRYKAILKVRDKTLYSAEENQKRLTQRLTSVRLKYSELSKRFAQTLSKYQHDKRRKILRKSAFNEVNGSAINGRLNDITDKHNMDDEINITTEDSDTEIRNINLRKRARSGESTTRDADYNNRRASGRKNKKRI